MLIILFKTKEEKKKVYLFNGEKLANFQNKKFKQMTN